MVKSQKTGWIIKHKTFGYITRMSEDKFCWSPGLLPNSVFVFNLIFDARKVIAWYCSGKAADPLSIKDFKILPFTKRTFGRAVDGYDVVFVKRTERGSVIKFETTTLWDFPKQNYSDVLHGDNKFPGVTPAFIIWNLLKRYTNQGDLVVDPMVGSGTTIDVAKELNRDVIGFDIAPYRKDIIKNDARKIPLGENSVDFVFIDSPYGDNLFYSDDSENIGHISAEDPKFYEELEKVAKEIYRILKPGKVMGWLIGDQWVRRKFTPVGFKIYQMLIDGVGFVPIDIICVTRHGQSSNTIIWQYRAQKFNFFLRGFKYLIIVRKPDGTIEKSGLIRTVKWRKYKR